MTPTDFMRVVDSMEMVDDHYELTAAEAMKTLSGLVEDAKAEAREPQPNRSVVFSPPSPVAG